jgi:hypothetical protein
VAGVVFGVTQAVITAPWLALTLGRMKTMLVEISDEAFRRLSRHACEKDTTAEKLAARFLCGAYCADEYDDFSVDEIMTIEHAWLHADPDMLHTDEGVRAYYDMMLQRDNDN